MKVEKLSVNKACMLIFALTFLICASMVTTLYLLTRNINVLWCGVLFAVLMHLCSVLWILLFRRKLAAFSVALCRQLDDMITGDIVPVQAAWEESLFYKINHRLVRLYEVMREDRRSIAAQRADLQELISDISHQVKTPISNIKIINAMLLKQPIAIEKQKEYLIACEGQLNKLDFLMQALIKTSRLETGVISLEKKRQSIYDTLAAALGGILLNAEQKDIAVEINCKEGLAIDHDRKWTSEALFNLLDNAVKYTPRGGRICVTVEPWEMHLKISIADTGKGIAESNQPKVFKRFYREADVQEIPGIGLGLYLARKIITMQGGYISVTSQVGHGAIFSVFLPYE